MGSTDLITYLNYMSTWETESEENIDGIISEQALFVNLGEFDSDTAVNAEFTTLYDLSCEVRDLTVAEDATQIAADGAAVAAIWSFGLGMQRSPLSKLPRSFSKKLFHRSPPTSTIS